MSRYIDADSTLTILKEQCLITAMNNLDSDIQYAEALEDVAWNRLEMWLKQVPTIDLVEVVRCKNCVKARDCCQEIILSDGTGRVINYCSYGERREDAIH